jgi:hypothetical protein
MCSYTFIFFKVRTAVLHTIYIVYFMKLAHYGGRLQFHCFSSPVNICLLSPVPSKYILRWGTYIDYCSPLGPTAAASSCFLQC